MIYLDNAATTFPKPQSVKNAVAVALARYGANPGRGGHTMSLQASQLMFDARTALVKLFNAKSENSIIFTHNCTQSLNMVLKGLLMPGDHVVVSNLEHNAVMRPLKKLSEQGVSYTQAKVFPCDNDATVNSFRDALNSKTKLIVCTHASNVWGIRLPVERITALAHQYGILVAVDAAQTAGIIPIDLMENNIDFLCVAGHKGLYGPMGTGVLIYNTDTELDTIIEGGTGTSSFSLEQPLELPERFESGTQNLPGIAGLKAGVDYVTAHKQENIAKHEIALVQRLYDRLSQIKGVKLYTQRPTAEYFAPVLSFNISDMDSEEAAAALNRRKIAVRAGLHCAPSAHSAFGTTDGGTVRVSPSAFTTYSDIDNLVFAVRKISAG